MSAPLVVGVAGGSGSGKSTVTRALAHGVDPVPVAHLSHDRYYRDLSHLSHQARARTNFDHPDALETELLVDHLDRLRAGCAVVPPSYDFVTHRRVPGEVPVGPAPVVLVEGVLILWDPEVRRRLDVRVFVDTDADLRLARRLRRDGNERGRSIDSVLEQYEATVRPMHLAFVEPSRRHAHIILPEGGHNAVGLEILVQSIRARVDPR
ncbi:MAG: uridine kinase [Gemmatimonadota bacterium]